MSISFVPGVQYGGNWPANTWTPAYFGSQGFSFNEAPIFSGATWSNQGATGAALTQSTVGFRPGQGTAINANPTLGFDGVDDVMIGGVVTGYFTSTAFALWVIFRTGIVGPSGGVMHIDRQLFGDSNGILGCNITSNASRFWAFDGGYKNTSAFAFASNTLYAGRFIFDAAGLRAKITGMAETASAACGTISLFTGDLWIPRTFGSGYGIVEMAGFFGVKRAPTSDEIANASAYCLAKYGVQP